MMDDDNTPELKALDQVVSELRDEPAPDLDWERMEQTLLAKLDETPALEEQRRFRWGAVAGLAAAAAVALFAARALTPAEPAPAPVAQQPAAASFQTFTSADVDGSALRVGDRVVAEGHAVRVQHQGLATWTLAAGGRAELVERAERLTVKLASGSVLAEVVPSAKPESFAVEVADTRVAVHGTVFEVKRQAERARVFVKEGVVAVGPASTRGATTGFVLYAGDSGSFSLDGKSGDVTRATAALPSEPEPETLVKPAPLPQAPLPEMLGINELESALDKAQAQVTRCFEQNTDSESGVRITARTSVTLSVAPSGAVSQVGFNPPLAPAVHQCADAAVRQIRLARTQKGGSGTRSVLLGP